MCRKHGWGFVGSPEARRGRGVPACDSAGGAEWGQGLGLKRRGRRLGSPNGVGVHTPPRPLHRLSLSTSKSPSSGSFPSTASSKLRLLPSVPLWLPPHLLPCPGVAGSANEAGPAPLARTGAPSVANHKSGAAPGALDSQAGSKDRGCSRSRRQWERAGGNALGGDALSEGYRRILPKALKQEGLRGKGGNP